VSDDKTSGETPKVEDDSEQTESFQGAEAVAHGPGDDGIIDAEVIDESPAPEPARPVTGNTDKSRTSPKSGFAAKAGWSVSVLLAAFVAGVYLAPQFSEGLVALGLREAPAAPPVMQASGSEEDISALRQLLEDQGKTVEALATLLQQHDAALTDAGAARQKMTDDIGLLAAQRAGAGQATDPAALARLQSEIERLTADVARLSSLAGEADPSVTQLTGALALVRAETSQLKARLAAIEDAMKAVEAGALEASPRGRLVLALGRLRDRALAGQSFAAGLAALRTDFARLPAIDQQIIGAELAVLEENGVGVSAYETLVADFDTVAAEVVKAQDKAEGGFLTGLFTSRRTDAGATGVDAVLLKAERSLLARDVPGALQALEVLDGTALAATDAWRHRATRHVAVTRTFDRLTARVANSTLDVSAEAGS